MSCTGATEVTVTLSWPPTGNHYKKPRAVAKGKIRWYLTSEAKAYHTRVWEVTRATKRFREGQRLRVDATLYPPDRRAFDVDNRVKVLLDSLQRAGIYPDDGQIDDLRITRGPLDRPDGKVVVTITEVTA